MQGPITEHVLMYARGKMPSGFANIAGTTAHTQKLIYHTRKKPTRDRIFHTNKLLILNDEKTSLMSMLLQ